MDSRASTAWRDLPVGIVDVVFKKTGLLTRLSFTDSNVNAESLTMAVALETSAEEQLLAPSGFHVLAASHISTSHNRLCQPATSEPSGKAAMPCSARRAAAASASALSRSASSAASIALIC